MKKRYRTIGEVKRDLFPKLYEKERRERLTPAERIAEEALQALRKALRG